MSDKVDNKKRKYLLFKKDDGRPDHLKPCAFFASADGCKNGNKCRFMHEVSSTPASIASPLSMDVHRIVPLQSFSEIPSLGEEATPKKEKKKRRTNEFMEQDKNDISIIHPATSLPLATLNPAQESYLKLLEQQRALEQQLNSLSATMHQTASIAPSAAAVTSNKTEKKGSTASSSSLKMNSLFPVSRPSSVSSAIAPVPIQVSASKEIKYESSSDDEDFLFKAVNHALDSGRTEVKKPSIPFVKPVTAPIFSSSATPSTMAENIGVDIAINMATGGSASNTFPFVEPSAALKALETSGTAHATQGPGGTRNKKKDIFASPTGRVSAPSSTSSTAVSLFDPASINFSSLDWDSLVQRTQLHKRFKQDYSFPTDQTWITARSLSNM